MRAVDLFSRARESPALARLRDERERKRRVIWPADTPSDGSVAAVVVNHNTRELISQLIFSLHRILGADQLATIVVVDNASTDGSLDALRALARAGLIELIANPQQRYHGSGLNQGISWLATHRPQTGYVWVLDSDTVVLRPDAVTDAVRAIQARQSAVIGSSFGMRDGYLHLAVPSLLLDPRQVWQRPIEPFRDDGAPEKHLLESAADAGLTLTPFDYLHHSYVLHLGSGTLLEVAKGEWTNRFYGWASRHHETGGHTYTHHPLGPRLHQAVLDAYAAEVPDGTPEQLVAACRRTERITIPEAQPLPPREVLQRRLDEGADLTEYVLSELSRSARGPATP